MVDGAQRDIRALGDVLHGGVEDALLVVEVEGGVDDAAPRIFDRLRALTEGVSTRGHQLSFLLIACILHAIKCPTEVACQGG